MINAIANLFGAVVKLIYNAVGQNYGLSIIIFAILSKLIMFPLSLKQAKATKNMKKIAPMEQELRKKYKGNNEKLGIELQKLYSEHKVNPLAGCLPALVQIPIILAMFYIVKQPLTYIKQLPKEKIQEYVIEMRADGDKEKKVTDSELKNSELEIASKKKILNMNFAGINFGDIPSKSIAKGVPKEERPSYITLIVPILSLISTIIQTKITQKNSNLTDEQKEQQKTMSMMMPFLSAYIAYIMPLALGIYWLIGGIIQLILQLIIEYIINGKQEGTVAKLLSGGREE